MTDSTLRAYQRWRRMAERGYGSATHAGTLALIDERIRRAKERYETALAKEKAENRVS